MDLGGALLLRVRAVEDAIRVETDISPKTSVDEQIVSEGAKICRQLFLVPRCLWQSKHHHLKDEISNGDLKAALLALAQASVNSLAGQLVRELLQPIVKFGGRPTGALNIGSNRFYAIDQKALSK